MKIYFKAVLAIVIAASNVACNKEQSVLNDVKEEIEITKSMTIDEFSSALSSEVEKDFFKTHDIVDLTSEVKLNLAEKEETAKPILRFRWGNGCNQPIGVCIIIPIGKSEMEQSNCILKAENDKLIIMPLTEDDGLTVDGVLPIFEDIEIPSIICEELGLSKGSAIEAGIYRASFDNQSSEYNYTVVKVK